MAKTNFSKVEDSLKAGLDRMNVDQIGKLADVAQRVARPELKSLMEKATKAAMKLALEKKAILHVVKQGLKEIDLSNFYQSIDCSKEQINDLLERSKELNNEEWEKLKSIKIQMLAHKEQYIQSHPEKGNDQLIKQQRKEHLNKRFNVKKKWLPLS